MSLGNNPSTSTPFVGDMEKDILILVVGDVGAGKSYFANRLLSGIGSKKRAIESDRQDPCTLEVEPIVIEEGGWLKRYLRIRIGGMRFIVVDTPGLDLFTAKRIGDWIKRLYPTPTESQILIGGIVYLHDMSKDRIPNTTHMNLLALRKSLPEPLLWSSVILVTTKWKYANGNVDADRKVDELAKKQWKWLLMEGGSDLATVMKFEAGSLDEEKKCALGIVQPILQRVEEWMKKGASDTLHHIENLFQGTRVKNPQFTQDLHAALVGAMHTHQEISDMSEIRPGEGKEVSEKEFERLEEEWKRWIEEIQRLLGQFSTWDKVLLVLQILFPRLLGRLYRTT